MSYCSLQGLAQRTTCACYSKTKPKHSEDVKNTTAASFVSVSNISIFIHSVPNKNLIIILDYHFNTVYNWSSAFRKQLIPPNNRFTQPKFPRGTKLTLVEQGKILAFKEEGLISTEIARRLNRSGKFMANVLRDPASYGTNKSPWMPSKLSPREKREIKWRFLKNLRAAPQLKETSIYRCPAKQYGARSRGKRRTSIRNAIPSYYWLMIIQPPVWTGRPIMLISPRNGTTLFSSVRKGSI